MTPFLDQSEPEFSASFAHGGLVADERFTSSFATSPFPPIARLGITHFDETVLPGGQRQLKLSFAPELLSLTVDISTLS